MIEKGVPLNTNRIHGNARYPWREMEVGDSFLVLERKITNFSAIANSACKRTGFKFTCRTVEGGVRVWRVK